MANFVDFDLRTDNVDWKPQQGLRAGKRGVFSRLIALDGCYEKGTFVDF